MGIYDKFLQIQKSVDVIVKDGENKNDKYDYVSGSRVLSIIRPMMNDMGLLLIPRIVRTNIIEGATRSGTARFVVELTLEMLWVDTESGEQLTIPSYANGSDLGSAERAVGKALTYNEKYHLLKLFHIPTDKDDPDNDGRTRSGEKRMTAAAKAEMSDYYRKSISAMLDELYAGDADKIKAGLLAITANKSRGYTGVDAVSALTDAALPVIYAKVKKTYEQRLGKPFEYEAKE